MTCVYVTEVWIKYGEEVLFYFIFYFYLFIYIFIYLFIYCCLS